FTLGLSLLWGLLLSLAPLGELLRTGPGRSLLPQGRTVAAPMRYRTRATLVMVQVGLSLVLLVGAGLMLRAFVGLAQVAPGFHGERPLTFRLAIPEQRYESREAFAGVGLELQRRLEALPGVTGVGAISHLPYDDLPNWATPYRLETTPRE